MARYGFTCIGGELACLGLDTSCTVEAHDGEVYGLLICCSLLPERALMLHGSPPSLKSISGQPKAPPELTEWGREKLMG